MSRIRRVRIGDVAVEYTVSRSKRRKKTLGLRVTRDVVEVAAPTRTAIREIEEILRRRGAWVLDKLKAASEQSPPQVLGDGHYLPYLGNQMYLVVDERVLDEDEVRRPSAQQDGDTVLVRVAPNLDDDARRDSVRAAIVAWYKVQLREFLVGRVAHWMPVMGRAGMPGVLVREQRSRWGSCSADGTLRFSWRLAMVEPELIDSVVVHELAHLEVMDHSPAFWAVVLKAMPDAKVRRRRLNDAGRSLPL